MTAPRFYHKNLFAPYVSLAISVWPKLQLWSFWLQILGLRQIKIRMRPIRMDLFQLGWVLFSHMIGNVIQRLVGAGYHGLNDFCRFLTHFGNFLHTGETRWIKQSRIRLIRRSAVIDFITNTRENTRKTHWTYGNLSNIMSFTLLSW